MPLYERHVEPTGSLWIFVSAITMPPITHANAVVTSGTAKPPARWNRTSRSATLGA
jgi:hypothetical protein